MPKCPQCKKNITHLYNDHTMWHRYTMGLSKIRINKTDEFKANYIELLKTWPAGENIFACPECDAELFYTEAKAVAFLKKK